MKMKRSTGVKKKSLLTDARVAGVVDPLLTAADGIGAGPLVARLLRPGTAPTGRAEGVATVPR